MKNDIDLHTNKIPLTRHTCQCSGYSVCCTLLPTHIILVRKFLLNIRLTDDVIQIEYYTSCPLAF